MNMNKQTQNQHFVYVTKKIIGQGYVTIPRYNVETSIPNSCIKYFGLK